jgi:integrase
LARNGISCHHLDRRPNWASSLSRWHVNLAGVAHVKKRVRTRRAADGRDVTSTWYEAVWREHAHAPDRTKTFKRKADAERFLVDVQHRVMTGAYADPQLGRTPFKHVAARYLELGVWRPRTRVTATEKLRYAVEYFGDRSVATIRKNDVQALLSGLAQSLAPNTVRLVRQHVAAAFERAVDDRLIAVNPCKGVKVPRVDREVVLPLAPEELTILLDHARPWFRVAVVIGAGLGLRQSEAAGLTIDRIDFLRRTVLVDRQWQQASSSFTGAFTPPKTAAGTRKIPTSNWVLEEITAHTKQFGTGADGVILHWGGRPLDAARFGYYVRAARGAAGLPDTVSFHSLRHFYASALIAAGCSVKQVQSVLGHESAKVTLDVYGHLWPGDDDRVRDAIDILAPRAIDEHGRSTA